jgi:hypothetical protein
MESNSENYVLSPPLIQRIPVELLAEIFLLCISTRSPPMVHATEPPTSLCRVCRTWREVALNLPRLWTALSVDMDALAAGAAENKSISDLVHQWVARASHLPLTFRFKLTGFAANRPTAFNAFVAPFAHRLRHLEMVSYRKLWSHLQFPVLEVVILHYRMADEYYNSYSAQLLPWNQLTHLCIGYSVYFSEFQEVFRECHRLQKGIFALFCTPPRSAESHESKQRVVLHYLADLTISFSLSIDVAILNPFELPALKILRVESDEQSDGASWAEVVHDRFFQQLLPIQKLRLGSTRRLPLSVLIDLLKATPHVFELDLQVDDECRDIFYFLQNYPLGKDLALPNLKTLLVGLTPRCWLQRDSLEIKIISNVVRSRIRTKEEGSRLEKLALYLGEGPKAEGVVDQLTKELQPWVDDGFHLEVKAGASNHWSGCLGSAATQYWAGGLVGLDRQ